MPKRKQTTRRKRLNDQVLESLRELILSGTPWTKRGLGADPGGGDIHGFISGHFFFPDYCSEEDEESQRALWEEVKDDIVREHINTRQGRGRVDGGDGNGRNCGALSVAIV